MGYAPYHSCQDLIKKASLWLIGGFDDDSSQSCSESAIRVVGFATNQHTLRRVDGSLIPMLESALAETNIR